MTELKKTFIERQADRVEKFLLERRNEWVSAWTIAEALVLDFPEVREALALLQFRGIVAFGQTGDVRIRPDASRSRPMNPTPD